MAKKRRKTAKRGAVKMAGKTCGPCPGWCGWLVLAIGVLYLLGDLGLFTWFSSTFSWWTVAFLLLGLKKVCK
jgi:hypothetical protein